LAGGLATPDWAVSSVEAATPAEVVATAGDALPEALGV
jgi:hypothetical protein